MGGRNHRSGASADAVILNWKEHGKVTTQEVLDSGRASASNTYTPTNATHSPTRLGRWRKVISLVAAAAAVASTGLIAGSVKPRHAAALDPIVCNSADILAAKPDGIYLTNKDTGASSPLITSAQVPGITTVNQVGVSIQGTTQTVIFTAIINGVYNVVRFDVATGTATTAPAPGAVAGGVNLNNGLYYFGSAGGGTTPGHAIINVLDPASGAVTTGVLDVTLPSGYGGNGDLMFDTAGNMYLVSADGLNYNLYRVSGPIPSTGTNQMTAQLISTSVGGPGAGLGGGINGIAFGSDGYIYVSGGGNLRQFNPINGALVDTVALPSATDLASCADPDRVRLYKNLPSGRYAAADQFALKIEGAAAVGNTATTTGTASGLQDQSTAVYVGPLVVVAGIPITISETPAPGSGAVLSNYVTTWTCVDESQGNLVIGSGNGTTGTFLVPKTGGVNVNCQFTNIPKGTLKVQKNLPSGRVSPGDQFTLSVSPGGAPAATTTGTSSGIQAESSTLALATPGANYTISEAAAGTTVLANYVSTWACVDTANGNRPVASGTGTSGTVPMPTPGGPLLTNVVCTFTNEPVVSTIKPSKSVSPPDGSTVGPGGDLTYTLTFDNTTGSTAATTNYVDDLAGVLDDATVTAVPTLSSGTGLSVSTIANGKFTIDGAVPAGSTAVVTYKVQVKPDGQRGDNQLLNFLLKPSTPTPTTCAAGDPLCTMNPVPQLAVSKSVAPADGTSVKAGQPLTYTVTFSNAQGKAPAPVKWSDNLAGVLDDATLTSGPTSSDPGVIPSAVASGAFDVTGTVAAGATVTVTYQVQVKPDGQRGDNDLLNFVFPTGTTPPATCAVGDPLCTENPIPKLVVSKSVDPADGSAVAAGQTLSYTLTFDNSAGKASAAVDWTDDITGVLDDATVTSAPAASNASLTASAVAGGKFAVTGSVAAGSTVTVTYKVQVKPDGQRGNNVLSNFVVPTGTTPPASCAVGDPLCTENPVPNVLVTKSVDPADGTAVAAGQTLTYTLTFDNSAGKAAAPVSWDDDVSGVLDDATLTTPPYASDPTWNVLPPSTRGVIKITGSVQAGATVTVTYKVAVKADNARGDNRLLNYLVPTGTEPPTVCAPGNPLCTDNPVPQLEVSKSVDPADGTTVVAGQTLTYTLKFNNSLGKAPALVQWTDDISGVLDDANIIAAPATSNPSLTASSVAAGKFTITGTVDAGATVTATYKVQVKPDNQRADNELLNFLVPTGTVPPTKCLVGDPLCTANQVPKLVVMKSVDPADGTAVVAGNVLTYTLTFDNSTGKAPADVDWSDDISGVLDDAAITSAPATSDPSLVATGPTPRGIVQIRGSVAAGSKATVTYKVQVKPNGERFDNALLNFVFPTGTQPPSTCAAADPLCTENPVSELVITKTVNPSDLSMVLAGDTLTYTLKFSNARGKAPAVVAMDDNLSKVLDDATVTAAPTSSNPALTVSPISNGVFTVRGTVAAGQTVDVTMKVQVNADGARGDNDLVNFLVQPGKPLPDACVAADPLCTENPVPTEPGIKLDKSVGLVVDTGGDGPSTPGDVVTFAFKVTNVGNVPLTDIVLLDPLLGQAPLNCPQTTLQPKASMDCTGPTYTLTNADLAATKVTNVATVTGKPPVGPRVNSTSSVVVSVNKPEVIPATGSSLPGRVVRIAPLLMILGFGLVVVGLKRRSRLVTRG